MLGGAGRGLTGCPGQTHAENWPPAVTKDRHAPPDPRIQVQEVVFDWGRPFEEALGPLNYGCEGVGDML